MIDKDNNGFVERAELVQVLESNLLGYLGQGTTMLNGKSVDEILETCDKDGNGVIDFSEFKSSLLS